MSFFRTTCMLTDYAVQFVFRTRLGCSPNIYSVRSPTKVLVIIHSLMTLSDTAVYIGQPSTAQLLHESTVLHLLATHPKILRDEAHERTHRSMYGNQSSAHPAGGTCPASSAKPLFDAANPPVRALESI